MKTCERCGVQFDEAVQPVCPRCGPDPAQTRQRAMAAARLRARCGRCELTFPGAPCPTCGLPMDSLGEPTLTCPDCGVTFMGRGGDPCPRCNKQVGKRLGVPWTVRRQQHRNFFSAMVRTVLATMFRPRKTFSDLGTGQKDGVSLSFLFIFLLVVINVPILPITIIEVLEARYWGPPTEVVTETLTQFLFLNMGIIGFYYLVLRALAGLSNIALRILGAERRTLDDTYAVFAYSFPATILFVPLGLAAVVVLEDEALVPAAVATGWLWSCVVATIGLSIFHSTSVFKAGAAILLAHLVLVLLTLTGLPLV